MYEILQEIKPATVNQLAYSQNSTYSTLRREINYFAQY